MDHTAQAKQQDFNSRLFVEHLPWWLKQRLPCDAARDRFRADRRAAGKRRSRRGAMLLKRGCNGGRRVTVGHGSEAAGSAGAGLESLMTSALVACAGARALRNRPSEE